MLETRSEEIEIMDDLNISGPIISQTLKELNTINRTLGGNQISISAFKQLSKNKANITIADLGCGGGDIMVEMAKWAARTNKNASFVGIDANPHIIEYAKENTSEYKEISYESINIFSEQFQSKTYDIIHCCLFLHHFTNDQLIDLFKKFNKQARIGVIINDLHRHTLAYRSIQLLTKFFSQSEMVRNDAAVSVARGFKKNELLHILQEAGISSFKLSWKWAFRWKLIF